MSQKMKANFYLDYPKHSYYEVSINPNKESPNSIIATVFQKLYPPHLHSYSTSNPAFIHVREGTTLDPDKTFAENGICKRNDHADLVPDIRIRLKIHILPSQSQPH
jgi:hypothetical protein